jgi:SAM-dependent methyltransferase
MPTPEKSYGEGFFASKLEGAQRSSSIIVPIVLELISVASVVDVGCGRGAWLAAFKDRGIGKLRGVDGIEPRLFLLDERCLISQNLDTLTDLDDEYDLAVCLEVAEHIPRRRAQHLVQALTRAAPVVLFSAAIPGQGGLHHVNEQWPDYWQGLFEEQGFKLFDSIRPRIRDDRRVDWWYRQNIVVFASAAGVARNPHLIKEHEPESANRFEWVYVDVVQQLLERRTTRLWRSLRNIAGRARRGVRWLSGHKTP